MSETQAVTTQEPQSLAALLRQPSYANRFNEVLGVDKARQFVSSLLSIGSTMKDVEPTSIISSAMIAASLDLPINKNLGFAWIVPYSDKGRKIAQFQMGYKGFIQLALRTAQYSRMNVRSVNAEAFQGYDEVGEPKIAWDKIDESKEAVGYVFAWKLTNGFTKVCYWTKSKVEAHASRYSQSYRKGYDSPWKTHFDEMAKKTLVKNELSRWGVLSIEFQNAVEADQAIDVEGSVMFPDNPEPEPLRTLRKPPLERKKGAEEVEIVNVTTEPPGTNATQAETPPMDERQEVYNPYAVLAHVLNTNEVSFSDFKDWLKGSGREQEGKFAADALNKITDLPAPFATALAADTKAMAKCCRLYGRNNED